MKPVYLGRGDDLYDATARLAALPAPNYLIPLWDLRPQFSIAYMEDLTGEAVAMAAEQVRDDVCDLVGQAWPVGRGRYRFDRDVTLAQLNRGVESATGGSGIGLSVVRELVTLHNGVTWIEAAAAGRGARVVVEMPARAAAVDATSRESVPEQEHAPAGSEP